MWILLFILIQIKHFNGINDQSDKIIIDQSSKQLPQRSLLASNARASIPEILNELSLPSQQTQTSTAMRSAQIHSRLPNPQIQSHSDHSIKPKRVRSNSMPQKEALSQEKRLIRSSSETDINRQQKPPQTPQINPCIESAIPPKINLDKKEMSEKEKEQYKKECEKYKSAVDGGFNVMKHAKKLYCKGDELSEKQQFKIQAQIGAEICGIIGNFVPEFKIAAAVVNGIIGLIDDEDTQSSKKTEFTLEQGIDKLEDFMQQQCDRVIHKIEELVKEQKFYHTQTKIIGEVSIKSNLLKYLNNQRSTIKNRMEKIIKLKRDNGRLESIATVYEQMSNIINVQISPRCETARDTLKIPEMPSQILTNAVFSTVSFEQKHRYLVGYGDYLMICIEVMIAELQLYGYYSMSTVKMLKIDDFNNIKQQETVKCLDERFGHITEDIRDNKIPHVIDRLTDFFKDVFETHGNIHSIENKMVLQSIYHHQRMELFDTLLSLNKQKLPQTYALWNEVKQSAKHFDNKYGASLVTIHNIQKSHMWKCQDFKAFDMPFDRDNHHNYRFQFIKKEYKNLTWHQRTKLSNGYAPIISADYTRNNVDEFVIFVTDRNRNEVVIQNIYNQWLSQEQEWRYSPDLKIDHEKQMIIQSTNSGDIEDKYKFILISNENDTYSLVSKSGNILLLNIKDGVTIRETQSVIQDLYGHDQYPNSHKFRINFKPLLHKQLADVLGVTSYLQCIAKDAVLPGYQRYLYFDPDSSTGDVISIGYYHSSINLNDFNEFRLKYIGSNYKVGFDLISFERLGMDDTDWQIQNDNQSISFQNLQFKIIFDNQLQGIVMFEDYTSGKYLSFEGSQVKLKAITDDQKISNNERFTLKQSHTMHDQSQEFVSDEQWDMTKLSKIVDVVYGLQCKNDYNNNKRYLYFDPETRDIRVTTQLFSTGANGFKLQYSHSQDASVQFTKEDNNWRINDELKFSTLQFRVIFHLKTSFVSFAIASRVGDNHYLSFDGYHVKLKRIPNNAITNNEMFKLVRINMDNFINIHGLSQMSFRLKSQNGQYLSKSNQYSKSYQLLPHANDDSVLFLDHRPNYFISDWRQTFQSIESDDKYMYIMNQRRHPVLKMLFMTENTGRNTSAKVAIARNYYYKTKKNPTYAHNHGIGGLIGLMLAEPVVPNNIAIWLNSNPNIQDQITRTGYGDYYDEQLCRASHQKGNNPSEWWTMILQPELNSPGIQQPLQLFGPAYRGFCNDNCRHYYPNMGMEDHHVIFKNIRDTIGKVLNPSDPKNRPRDGIYNIISVNDNHWFLEISGKEEKEGGTLISAAGLDHTKYGNDSAIRNQQWYITKEYEVYYKIMNVHSGLYLTVSDVKDDWIKQYKFNGQDDQLFRFIHVGDDNMLIMVKQSDQFFTCYNTFFFSGSRNGFIQDDLFGDPSKFSKQHFVLKLLTEIRQ